MGEWILLAMAPVFLGFVLWEAWFWRRRGVDRYTLKDTVSNATLALMHQGADALAWLAVIGLYWWVYQFRLFEIPTTWWTIVLLFVAQGRVVAQLPGPLAQGGNGRTVGEGDEAGHDLNLDPMAGKRPARERCRCARAGSRPTA